MQSVLGDLANRGVCVAVPKASSRIKTKGVINTVYSGGLPEGAFVEVGDGICISSPELLFVELAPLMGAATHLMLGFELCGTFSRAADDPRDGDATFGLAPVTSVSRLKAFVDESRGLQGLDLARETLSRLSDNAWSPLEAIVATVVNLPIYRFGYGYNNLVLNKRIDVGMDGTRVPDMLFGETGVGINYDGEDHLDLDSIERAVRASQNATTPEEKNAEIERAKRAVRAKVIDDTRRNRDLGSRGYVVFPVTKEDLYQRGGFDAVMRQVYEAIARYSDEDVQDLVESLVNKRMASLRQELLWALLPGEAGKAYSKLLLPARKSMKPFAPNGPTRQSSMLITPDGLVEVDSPDWL